MADRVRTIAAMEPTKPAIVKANEVMKCAVDEFPGVKCCLIYFDTF